MVKQGYKETEIGVVPSSWDVKLFESVGEFYKGAGISMKDVVFAGYPCIMYGDIYVKFDTHFTKCDYSITAQTAANSSKAKHGDLFFTASGETAEEIGKCVSYQGDRDIYIGGDIIAIRPSLDYDSLFLAYVQNSFFLISQKASFAQGCSVVHISGENIKKLVFAAPPLPEQRRIAEVLTDVDSLIESLEKLIAKKKAIKQGAMQELLTGKKRLPGFTGEWVEKKLDALLSSAKSGGTPLTSVSSYYNGNIPFLSINDMTAQGKYLRYASNNVSREGIDNSSSFVVPIESLIYSMYASVGFVSIAKIQLAISQAVLCLIVNDNCDTEFLYYMLCHTKPMIFKYVGEGTQKNLTAKAVKSFKLVIPKYKAEQTAIATVLSDMDSEITELEQKLLKYRNIKTGMMQTLLTGKIRLPEEKVIENAAVAQQEGDMTVPNKKRHNRQFDDAVAIAAIVNAFYSEKYPLGRKKVQKLLYLMRRKQEVDTTEFKKKAAGPYAEGIRYKGGEKILKNNGYANIVESPDGAIFSKGKNIGVALKYVSEWNWQSVIDWLFAKFRYVGKDKLEVLATIDMAICDLIHSGETPSFETVKHLIASNKEWKEKLNKAYFSDEDIKQAFDECYQLFNYSRG